jgi:PiT family inorganic phosphate transporter
VGAVGISAGLLLFGAKMVRTVGGQITRMNPTRAFCVALSAAITVIAASALGLPVSSTHIAVGAVFGVGFYREYQTARRRHINHGKYTNYGIVPKADPTQLKLRRKLFRRRHLFTIVAAWVITVPCAGVLAGGIYYLMRLVLR